MRAMSTVIPLRSKELHKTTIHLPVRLKRRIERLYEEANYGLNEFLVLCLSWGLEGLRSGRLELPETPPELTEKLEPTPLRIPSNYMQEIEGYALQKFHTRNSAVVALIQRAVDQHVSERDS